MTELRDSLKQKKQACVQDEILGVAACLFAQKGFRAISISDIAKGMGYTKSVIYYYFKSKNEILWQIFNRMHDCYQSAIDEVLAKGLPSDQALSEILFQHAMNVMRQRDWTVIYFRDECELEPEQRTIMRIRKREYDTQIEAIYIRGVRDQLFKDIPSYITISGFMGMCNWLHTWFDAQGELSAEQVASYYASLLAGGHLHRAQ